MPNMMDSAQFMRLLDDRLAGVLNRPFDEIHPMIDALYNRKDHDSAIAEFSMVGAMPDVPVFTGTLEYLSVNPGFYNAIEPREYAAGIMLERKLVENDRYNIFTAAQAMAGPLYDAGARVMDKIAARPFQNAFSAVFDYQQSEEGLSLCNSAHLTKSGVSTSTGFSNYGTTALSKTAVAATRILMRQFKGDVGERIEINPDTLIVPDALLQTALEIVGTDYGLYNNEGTINVFKNRFKVIPYLRLDDNSATNWFMVDSKLMHKWLLWLDRIKPEIKSTVDFETFAIKHSLYFQVANGFLDWRWIFGQNA